MVTRAAGGAQHNHGTVSSTALYDGGTLAAGQSRTTREAGPVGWQCQRLPSGGWRCLCAEPCAHPSQYSSTPGTATSSFRFTKPAWLSRIGITNGGFAAHSALEDENRGHNSELKHQSARDTRGHLEEHTPRCVRSAFELGDA